MNWLQTFFDIVLPDTCVLCNRSQTQRSPHLLCPYCWAALPRNVSACTHCGIPQPTPGACGACLQVPFAEICVAALRHEGDARTLVHQLKYTRNLRAATPLTHAMLQAIELKYAQSSLPEVLLPVPLSWRRQVQRGHNQAAWLAYRLGQHLQLPVLYDPIKRRHGPAQQTLSRSQRLKLSKSAFVLSAPLAARHVAVVDDVLTTGATVRALSELLTGAGVERVDVWSATRAMPS